ncbi:methyltransferase [Stutzerimonas stutzeri]|uniref:Methyltransferase n=1 Tax=Stutzerimonas stutzeri TaxID=316 RepID=W8R122_STUST|nr:class I SAM-dependent methyltransferase [Stutzerimonas stutzeri]AHL76299.1 methyltransferase [Stutzerimonas stutzeri]MCQ4329529.1 DUF1442 domain-containing protein [Stutzerimonas stutzeri]
MDDRVKAVFDTYHAHLLKEREQRQAGQAANADWRTHAFLAVGPNTGQLINTLVRSLDAPTILELGTSFGYSTLWLAEAAQASGGRVVTMELHQHKSDFARDMAEQAGLASVIDFKVGDALELIDAMPERIDFVLLDLWKDLYVPCLERFYPKLNPGATIVADNMIRPGGEQAAKYRAAIAQTPGLSSVLLPVGTGLEVSRLDS